jgi:hypothetical protein
MTFFTFSPITTQSLSKGGDLEVMFLAKGEIFMGWKLTATTFDYLLLNMLNLNLNTKERGSRL